MKNLSAVIILIALLVASCVQEQESEYICECFYRFDYFDNYTGPKEQSTSVIVNDCHGIEEGIQGITDDQSNVIGESFVSCEKL